MEVRVSFQEKVLSLYLVETMFVLFLLLCQLLHVVLLSLPPGLPWEYREGKQTPSDLALKKKKTRISGLKLRFSDFHG